jgi:hypothetical protein
VRAEASLTIDEGERVDLSRFAKTLAKRTTAKARPSNYQTCEQPVRAPAFKEGQRLAAVSLEDWTIPAIAE